MLTSTKYLVFLKASATWDAEPTHFTLVKQRPLCADIAYRPMSPHGGDASARLALSTGRGPYCCEGAGCPSEDEYDQAQFACEMPALSPRGVPRCANLRGVPLPNLALASAGALAAISSAYPFTENAGANAAVDGRLDGRWGGVLFLGIAQPSHVVGRSYYGQPGPPPPSALAPAHRRRCLAASPSPRAPLSPASPHPAPRPPLILFLLPSGILGPLTLPPLPSGISTLAATAAPSGSISPSPRRSPPSRSRFTTDRYAPTICYTAWWAPRSRSTEIPRGEGSMGLWRRTGAVLSCLCASTLRVRCMCGRCSRRCSECGT
jgi:hypothetical protein